jgi:4-diphosphocytidyl-2C-methyl-D-erythritol kinase
VIKSLKDFGADYVQMSGAGSAVFGVFSYFDVG